MDIILIVTYVTALTKREHMRCNSMNEVQHKFFSFKRAYADVPMFTQVW